MGIVLFIVAILLFGIVYPIAMIALMLMCRNWNDYFKQLAIAIDEFGNVAFQHGLNWYLLTPKSNYKFGQQGVTISRVLGINKPFSTLTPAGERLAKILDQWDTNHVEKAANK